MPVLEATLNPAYLMGALVFLFVIGMAIVRQKESNAISRRFPEKEAKIVAFAVTFFGEESKNKKPRYIQGALILTGSTLVFQSRFGDRGYDLPLNRIKTIGTTDRFCGKALHQTVVSIDFKNDENKPDRVAYKIPHPARWVQAIRESLIAGSSAGS